jgi:hypothetical protein
MTCEIVGTERALFVAWGTPHLEDIDRVIEHLRSRAGTSTETVFYVTRVPQNAPAPEDKVRKQLNQRLPNIIHYCASYHVILEGDGFASAMKRGVLLSLFQLTQKRGIFYVHANLEAFRQSVPAIWRNEINRLLVLAEAHKLVEGQIPSERTNAGSGEFRIDRERPRKPNSKEVA